MDTDGLLQSVQAQINANNAWSAEQAQKQMDFQERMSNTAHQREIADLQASGLNPILSAKLGGASTPSGSMADADPNATSAFVSMIGKILDIESDNAKANLLRASSGSGYLGTGVQMNSANSLSGKDINGLLALTGERLPSSASQGIDAINKIGFSLGDKIADTLGIAQDSRWRDYLTGNWNLGDTVDLAKNAINNITSYVSNAYDTPKDEQNFVQKVANTAKNAVDKIVSVAKEDAWAFKEGVKKTSNFVSNTASNVINAVKNIFTHKKNSKVIKKGSTR